MSPAARFTSTQLDPLASTAIREQLPGVVTAFDPEGMRGHLQTALFGAAGPGCVIARCEPGKSVYIGDCCLLRYTLELRDAASGRRFEALVIGRVFPEGPGAASYLRDKLAPLVERMRGRDEIASFATPAALIEPLNMVVSVFPIDGELPVLVDVTDAGRMRGILGEMLRAGLESDLEIQDCRVELGHYGRQHRCVLRYQITASQSGRDHPRSMVVYGKVASDGRGALAGPIVAALRKQALDGQGHAHFNIPRCLGFREDLQLALFEAIPGVPQVAQLIRARLAGADPGSSGSLTLERSLDACGEMAAALHTCEVSLGRIRTVQDDLDGLRQGFAIVQRVSPDLGGQFVAWLERVGAYARQSEPLRSCLSHGDFSYTQLIFDGLEGGIVDFDTICQAEPALDLGQFLAYVRVAVLRGLKSGSSAATATIEELCEGFGSAYRSAKRGRPGDELELRMRVRVYECISLLRLGLHSWQKLKGSRLEYVMAALEERVSCLPEQS